MSVSIPSSRSLVVTLALLLVGALHGQSLPSRTDAIGNLAKSTSLEQAAFQDDPAFFEPIRKARPGDWLAQHDEQGQTFAQYSAMLNQVKPLPNQKMLYVLPLGEFKGTGAPSIDVMQRYCTAFLGMETRLLDTVPFSKIPAKQRINEFTKQRQFLTTDILAWMTSRKPADTYAMIAVTMEDLYPGEEWNYVFGQATLMGGVGVFSFVRYAPSFHGEKDGPAARQLIVERSLKILTHEMTHMFGLRHCVFFECLMNGANHLQEIDSRPMHLCPVCLRKLHLGASFDLLAREQQLLGCYRSLDIGAEAGWTSRRIDKFRAVK